eukprot:7300744-Pyramimonas_sp.AAC.1
MNNQSWLGGTAFLLGTPAGPRSDWRRLDKEKGLRVIWCEDIATTTSDGQPPGDHLSEVVLHHQLLWNALTLLLYFKDLTTDYNLT